jgi:hypothetical protein
MMLKFDSASGRFSIWLGMFGLVMTVACGDGFSEGITPQINVFVGNQASQNTEYELGQFEPGTNGKAIIKIQVGNGGQEDLIISSVELLDTNKDGTPMNQNVSLSWTGQNPVLLFPFTIKGSKGVSAQRLKFHVVYQESGDEVDTNDAILRIKSNDPEKKNGITDIRFYMSDCILKTGINPPSDTFFNATTSKPEEKIFEITNEGTCDLVVDSVVPEKQSSVFTLIDAPTPGSIVKPVGDPGHQPLTFRVRYQPNASSVDDKITYLIYTNDPSANPVSLPLKTKLESGTYKVTYDTMAKGFLDFSDISPPDSKTITVNINNIGPAVFTLTKVELQDDSTNSHYTVEIQQPATSPGGFPTPKTLPFALAEGKSLEVLVTYTGATAAGLNTGIKFSYNQPDLGTFTIPAYGGSPKPCFDFAPGNSESPQIMQFNKGHEDDSSTAVTSDFVIYNCGNAPLSVVDIKIEDDFYPDQPSKVFSLTSPGAAAANIPVGGLQVYSLTMQVTDNSPTVGGTMYIDYVDQVGTTVTFTGVDLQGIPSNSVILPIANPGTAADYAGAKVGNVLTLNGSGSTGGGEGLYKKGYLWMLKARPAGSQVILNGPPDTPLPIVIPDMAGDYTFGLTVHGESGGTLFGNEAEVTVTVAP